MMRRPHFSAHAASLSTYRVFQSVTRRRYFSVCNEKTIDESEIPCRKIMYVIFKRCEKASGPANINCQCPTIAPPLDNVDVKLGSSPVRNVAVKEPPRPLEEALLL